MAERNQNLYMSEKIVAVLKDNTKRIQEIDMAKGILILLMVTFHIEFFNTKYPDACPIMYAFIIRSPAFATRCNIVIQIIIKPASNLLKKTFSTL